MSFTARRRRASASGSVPGFEAQVRLWGLRLLAYAARWGDPDSGLGHGEAVGFLLGLTATEREALSPQDLRQRMRQALQAAERSRPSRRSTFADNLAHLAGLLDLDAHEAEVLTFLVAALSHPQLREASELVGELPHREFLEMLAQATGLARAEVERALRFDGTLRVAGLIELHRSGIYSLRHKVELLAGLSDTLLTPHRDVLELFDGYFRLAAPASRALPDYPHLQEHVLTLLALLRGALAQSARGVNILLHGPPGTGKTELTRALARALGVALYEVVSEGSDGEGLEGKERLRAYRLSQRVLARNRARLLLFDEVEDAFPDTALPFFGRVVESGRRKGFMNRLLEENAVPAFWVSNAVAQIDPAFLRRFDYVLEVPVPPRPVRRAILDAALGDLGVSAAWRERLAGSEDLTPADIERGRKVVGLIQPAWPAEVEAALDRVLRGSLGVRGGRLPGSEAGVSVTPYRLDYCATRVPLERIAAGLARRRSGRLCLFGPPGTGKTAFARHLAERLGCELLERRASDLLGMYVGQTEARIAAMFREAAEREALLLLDEADSFLRDRRGAAHGWEVTQVNELLKQMEAFEGIFVCATNLMDRLDPAVLRRFDIKVEYGYLTPQQAWQLLTETAGLDTVGADRQARLRARLNRLDALTPGDFATVMRRADILGEPLEPELLVAGFEEECAAKPGGRRHPIGFVD